MRMNMYARMTQGLSELPLSDTNMSLRDTARHTGTLRIAADFEGANNNNSDYYNEVAFKTPLERAYEDMDYAATHPDLLRVVNVIKKYKAVLGELVTLLPLFETRMAQMTNKSMFETVNWLYHNNVDIRRFCDIEGVSVQMVPASQRTCPDPHEIAARTAKECRDDAIRCRAAAERYEQQALALENKEVYEHAHHAESSLFNADDTKLLIHGQSLLDTPNLAIPVFSGQQLTLTVPSEMAICIVDMLPSDYKAFTEICKTCLPLPVSVCSDNMAFIDVVINETFGKFFFVDLKCFENTRKFAGAHLHIMSEKTTRQRELVDFVEHVVSKRSRFS